MAYFSSSINKQNVSSNILTLSWTFKFQGHPLTKTKRDTRGKQKLLLFYINAVKEIKSLWDVVFSRNVITVWQNGVINNSWRHHGAVTSEVPAAWRHHHGPDRAGLYCTTRVFVIFIGRIAAAHWICLKWELILDWVTVFYYHQLRFQMWNFRLSF